MVCRQVNTGMKIIKKIMDGISIITEKGVRVSVDAYESWDNTPANVWLNIAVPMASASAVLTREQAKELAAHLIAFAEAA